MTTNMVEELKDNVRPSYISDGMAVGSGEHPGTMPFPQIMTALCPPVIGKYSLRSPSTNNRSQWNAFQHYSRNVDVSRQSKFAWSSAPYVWMNDSGLHEWHWRFNLPDATCAWNSNNLGDVGEPLVGVPPLYQIQNGELVIPPPLDLSLMLRAAMDSMLPQIRAKSSMPNSVYELKDMASLKDTIHLAKKALGSLYDLKRGNFLHFSSFMNHFKRKTAKQVSRSAADVYLQYKFNIKPLLTDIYNCASALYRHHKHAEKLLKDVEQVQTHHYQMMISSDESDNTYWSQAYPIECVVGNSLTTFWARSGRFVSFRPATFHAEMEYVYYYSDWQRRHAALLTLLDDLGVNFNPAIIWNAIPWSFVVDWVVNVSSWLSQFRMTNMEPVIVINKALWSIKRERQLSLFVDAGDNRGLPVAHVWETAYRRNPWDVNSVIWSINTSGLSATETSLAVALGVSHRKRR